MKKIIFIILILGLLFSNSYGVEDSTIYINLNDNKLIKVYKGIEYIIMDNVNKDNFFIPITIKKSKSTRIKINFNRKIDPENLYFTNEKIIENSKFNIDVYPEQGNIIITAYSIDHDYHIQLKYNNYFKNKIKDNLDKEAIGALKIIELYEEGQIEKFQTEYEKMNLIDENYLTIKYVLDYYDARAYYDLGQYEKALEKFKTGYIIEDKNLYYNITINKELNKLDLMARDLKKALDNSKQSLVNIWARKEVINIPKELCKDQLSDYILRENNNEPKKDFNYKSFIMMNSGIVILLLVFYYNIKKK